MVNRKNSSFGRVISEPIYRAYNCQQAVEKYLKAYLSRTDGFKIPRTHDIALLLRLCADHDMDLSQFDNDHAVQLTYFAIEARYPGDLDIVSREEAASAFAVASQIRDYITGVLL